MLTTTGATAPLAQERRRAAGLSEDGERALPLLQDPHHAGVDTNRALAAALIETAWVQLKGPQPRMGLKGPLGMAHGSRSPKPSQ